jgi:surface polysaccharide O-acyltransferase-like enzyme
MDIFLTALSALLESITWFYPPAIIALWLWNRWNPSALPNISRVLYACNTLLLYQAIAWTLTFLVAWGWPIIMAVSDLRPATAYLPEHGTQFVITSWATFFIGLIPFAFYRQKRRYLFSLSFLIIAIAGIWKAVLDMIDLGHINLRPSINIETLLLFLVVFTALLYLTFRLTRHQHTSPLVSKATDPIAN